MKYLSRDRAHLQFNLRVSDEAQKNIPRGDQVTFHGIAHSNLQEFLQVRYPAAVESSILNDNELEDLLKDLSKHYIEITDRWRKFNKKYGIVRKVNDLKPATLKWLEKEFKNEIFPAIQPFTIDKSRPMNPHAGMYLLVITEDKNEDDFVNYIEIPKVLPRFIAIPNKSYCVAVEDVITYFLKYIFKDRKIKTSYAFSMVRSAEVYTQPHHHLSPYELINETLHEREKAWITALEIGTTNKKDIKRLRNLIPLSANSLVFASDYVRLSDLKKIPSSIYTDEQKCRKPKIYDTFPNSSIFEHIKKEDHLCFHPFESYHASMVRFLEEAAEDKDVLSIKISLYRVSDNSDIIAALLKAADKGKSVTVLVELKARFDEHHNMEISDILREGGVRLVYTDPNMKTHAKVCIVTRKEKKGLRIYSQVGTGNYSESNSKLYTDYSYFTADQDIGYDLTRFFNLLTSNQGTFKSKHIVYAPYNMRDELNECIDKEIKKAKKGKPARIICKCNAFADTKMADKIVEAAKAGVKVTMIIRGACIVRPMKNIRIYSIVGQYLEHSRVYIFGYGKDADYMIGSADLMTRNLSHRYELLIRVSDSEIKKRLQSHIDMYLKDNTQRRIILDNYKYEDVKPKKGEKPFNCQEAFAKEAKRISNS